VPNIVAVLNPIEVSWRQSAGMFTSAGAPAGLGIPAGDPSVSGAATTPVSPSAGLINIASTKQREIQFGLKLLW
jgi:hypothetical protein